MLSWSVIIITAVAQGQLQTSEPRVAFPLDPLTVIDARRDLGARGDGVTDDTDALQRGIDLSSGLNQTRTKVLFIPRGTYRLTRSLVVSNALGPWVYGEQRSQTVLKLDDNLNGVTAVLRTHPREQNAGSADWFMRNFRNLTIDVGNNPQTDGVRWFSNNSGMLKDVIIRGNGRIGVNSGFLDQAGPSLVQDVLISGFDIGVLSQWIWGQTLSRVTIRNCREVGVKLTANVVAMEELTVERTPMALRIEQPNDWYWWAGVGTLLNGRFSGNNANSPAIRNDGVLYARNVKASGFSRVLESSTEKGSVEGSQLTEYVSHFVRKAFGDAPESSLGLPIKREPVVGWETNPARWLCANDFGITVGDGTDDTAAIQAALNAAANQGKTVVYFRGQGGGDPNWILMNGTVQVRGSVRMILGLGWGRIIGNGRFVVSQDSAPVVKFQHIDAFGGPPVTLENASQNRTLVVESCGVKVVGSGLGDIFVTDMPGTVELRNPGQSLWARHLNPEGNSDTGLMSNHGGRLWALGVKHEGTGVRLRTTGGGKSEIFGVFNYLSGVAEGDQRPAYEVVDAELSVAGLREIAFSGGTSPIKVRETQAGETREANKAEWEHYWIGWPLFRSKAR